MAWIESHQSLATHRKTLALRRLLGISRAQAIGHLHLLWWWCLDNAPDGNLEGIDPSDLGIAMDWSGDANTIIGCLVKVGFIDSDMRVHSWDEYAGKLLIQRASNAEKQRRHREKQAQLLLSPPRNRDITVMSRLRNGATVPNSTVPNSTVPNSTVPTKEIDKESEQQPTTKLHDTFFSFRGNGRYSTIDFDNEFAKFSEYWLDGHRKLQRPKLAAHNWLDRCLERNRGGDPPQPGGGNNSDPDKYIKGKYGHMVQR